jgi:hypothetical protein
MGDNLPSVDLGAGRTAVAVIAGGHVSCVLLVRLHLDGWELRTCIIRQSVPTLDVRGKQMPSPEPWKMIRYFHSNVLNPS